MSISEKQRLENFRAWFTTENKILLCEEALRLFKIKHANFICLSIAQAYSAISVHQKPERYLDSTKVFHFLPELLKYRPTETWSRGTWWEPNNRAIRIRTLKKIIADLKKPEVIWAAAECKVPLSKAKTK